MKSTICLYPCKGTALRGTELDICYHGDTLHGKRHGLGTYHYPNRFFKYEGQYLNGKKHGLGKFWMSDGSCYEGAFKDDEIEGQGCRYFANGNIYRGGFQLGEMHGFGVLTLKDSDVYEGTFEANKFQGQGYYSHANGDSYTGEFHQHKRHGYGVLQQHSGDRYEGSWQHGRRAGQGIAHYCNNDVYEGEWEKDAWHGEGEWKIWRWKIIYRGQFINGAPAAMAKKLNVLWNESAEVLRKKELLSKGAAKVEPVFLELEAGQRYARPITVAAQCSRPLSEDGHGTSASHNSPTLSQGQPPAPPHPHHQQPHHQPHHSQPPQLVVYSEPPPEGQQWVTATMEYGRQVLMTLHTGNPQPLPENTPFNVHICTVRDEETGEVGVKLLLLQVAAPPCQPIFVGGDDIITAVHMTLEGGQHMMDSLILGDFSDSGQLAIQDGNYTLLFSSWAIEPGVLQVKITNKALKAALASRKESMKVKA